MRVSHNNYSNIHGFKIQPYETEQAGSGIIDLVKIALAAPEVYSSGPATFVKNLIPSSDSNARPGFAGEKHMVLKLPNGKAGIANYAGPGTQVVQRIKRGDPPRTVTDRAAMVHDIEYTLAESDGDLRRADHEMISTLQKAAADGTDSKINTSLAVRALQAKMLAENAGLLAKDKFAQPEHITKKDKAMLKTALKGLKGSGVRLAGQRGKGVGQLLKQLKIKIKVPKSALASPQSTVKYVLPQLLAHVHPKTHKQLTKLFINDLKGKGLGLPGGSFFKSFYKGFREALSVAKDAAPIIATVAPLLL